MKGATGQEERMVTNTNKFKAFYSLVNLHKWPNRFPQRLAGKEHSTNKTLQYRKCYRDCQ